MDYRLGGGVNVPNKKLIKKEWSEKNEVANLQAFDIRVGTIDR